MKEVLVILHFILSSSSLQELRISVSESISIYISVSESVFIYKLCVHVVF